MNPICQKVLYGAFTCIYHSTIRKELQLPKCWRARYPSYQPRPAFPSLKCALIHTSWLLQMQGARHLMWIQSSSQTCELNFSSCSFDKIVEGPGRQPILTLPVTRCRRVSTGTLWSLRLLSILYCLIGYYLQLLPCSPHYITYVAVQQKINMYS